MLLTIIGVLCGIITAYFINLFHAILLYDEGKISPLDANQYVRGYANQFIYILFAGIVTGGIVSLVEIFKIIGILIFLGSVAIGFYLRRITGNPLIGGKISREEYDTDVSMWQKSINNYKDKETSDFAIKLMEKDLKIKRKVFGVKGLSKTLKRNSKER